MFTDGLEYTLDGLASHQTLTLRCSTLLDMCNRIMNEDDSMGFLYKLRVHDRLVMVFDAVCEESEAGGDAVVQESWQVTRLGLLGLVTRDEKCLQVLVGARLNPLTGLIRKVFASVQGGVKGKKGTKLAQRLYKNAEQLLERLFSRQVGIVGVTSRVLRATGTLVGVADYAASLNYLFPEDNTQVEEEKVEGAEWLNGDLSEFAFNELEGMVKSQGKDLDVFDEYLVDLICVCSARDYERFSKVATRILKMFNGKKLK
jgi:hypothetical protein